MLRHFQVERLKPEQVSGPEGLKVKIRLGRVQQAVSDGASEARGDELEGFVVGKVQCAVFP